MNISLRKPVAALAACIAIALSACGGSSSSSSSGSGSSGGGGAIDPPLTAPTISAQAENQSVVKGETATFKVVATGSALTYQWKKNGSDISGATSSSYTTPPTTIADNGAKYSVSVSNSVGTVTSNTATLEVVAKPVAATITTQPADQSALTGQTATFLVKAAGTSLSYQWKKNGTDIPGATSSSYTTPATTLADNGTKYSVSVSNTEGQVPSSAATLTVSDTAMAPAITTQPAAQSVTAGQTATFSVIATGTSLKYQWKKGGTDIAGATASTYTTPATSMADSGAVFTVVVINSAGNATSSSATLTVNQRYSLVANASGGTYALTECVKDNSTGLVWEGKNPVGSTSRLGTSAYTNYDDANSAQKWVSGATYVNPTQAQIDASTNSIGYKNAVNASALCGYTDWRLPTNEELEGILASSGSPRIDTTWFPNTQAWLYWSSSPEVGYSSNAWNVYFSNGYVYYGGSRNGNLHVRLVR